MVKAATELNRFSIVYELAKNFVDRAVERFNMTPLYEASEIIEPVEEMQEDAITEVLTIEIIPEDVTEFQKNFLVTLSKSSKRGLLSDADWSTVNQTNSSAEINSIFRKANQLGYSEYKKPCFDIDLIEYEKIQPLYEKINKKFEEMFDVFIRPYYENIRIENQCFAEYLVKHPGRTLKDYLGFIEKHFPDVNVKRTQTILTTNNLVA